MENGTRLPNKYIDISTINFSERVKTNLNGTFRCIIRAPAIPGEYYIEACYRPENYYLKYARNRVRFTVKNIEVKIIVTEYNRTLYPQQKLTVKGFIEPKIKLYNVSGEIAVDLFKRQLKTKVIDGKFNFTITIPYNVAKGTYYLALTYSPSNRVFSRNHTVIPINIIDPPYLLSFKISLPKIVVNIFGLGVDIQPICKMQSNVTIYLKISNGKTIFHKKYDIYTNESKNIHIDLPYYLESGSYIIEIIGVPKNPLIKYRKERINIFILNINALITSLLATFLLAIYITVNVRGKLVFKQRVEKAIKTMEIEAKPITLDKIREISLPSMSLHRLILTIEIMLSKILGIKIEPGDTHREICKKIYLRNPIIGELLLNTIYIFEKTYYGLKILSEGELKLIRDLIQKIIKYIRGGGH